LNTTTDLVNKKNSFYSCFFVYKGEFMNAKLIIYCKEKIQNYESLKQLCLLMNIEIILLNEQMTQNKVKDILNKKIKKTKKNNLEPAVVVFSNVASLQMDQILSKLKNNSTLCLKAIVTATNYNWTFEKLVLHLLEEYQKNK